MERLVTHLSDGTPIEDKRRAMAAFFGEEFEEKPPRIEAGMTSTEPEAVKPGHQYVVEDPRHYYKGGIVDSVPVFMADKRHWRKSKKLSRRYDSLNCASREARRKGRKDYKFLSEIAPDLLAHEKKMLVNRLRSGRDVIFPVPVTILSVHPRQSSDRVGLAEVETKEFGVLEVGDYEDIPHGLKTGYLLRFRAKSGDGWFRLGWKRADEERALRPRRSETP
jgi:hypothetical protein